MPAGLAWTTSLSGCFATCAATPGCLAVSFVPASGACYMKSSLQAGVHNANVIGGQLVRKPAAVATSAAANVAVSKSVSVSMGATTLATLRTTTFSTMLARRAIVGGPDYTYPVLPTTTITVGTSTLLLTSTPSPPAPVIISSTATITATTTLTPAASGVATTTVVGLGGLTSWGTVTVQGVAQTSTRYVGGVTTTRTVLVQGQVQSQTVRMVATSVVTGVVTRTVGSGVVTVSSVGCW